MSTASDPKNQAYYDYLDKLRDSGVTNMWVAGPYLARAFSMERKRAGKIVLLWMKEFSKAEVKP